MKTLIQVLVCFSILVGVIATAQDIPPGIVTKGDHLPPAPDEQPQRPKNQVSVLKSARVPNSADLTGLVKVLSQYEPTTEGWDIPESLPIKGWRSRIVSVEDKDGHFVVKVHVTPIFQSPSVTLIDHAEEVYRIESGRMEVTSRVAPGQRRDKRR